MKDISNKRAQPLDLSQQDNISYSPYTLDLTEKRDKSEQPPADKPDRRQMNFFEYMPAAAAASHPDDEFGERVQAWLDGAKGWLATVWHRIVAVVAPLRMFWVVTGGVGLIIGLAIVAYLATHRNWTAALPLGSPATTKQGDGALSPGKGAGAGAPGATSMPAVGAEKAASGGRTTGAGVSTSAPGGVSSNTGQTSGSSQTPSSNTSTSYPGTSTGSSGTTGTSSGGTSGGTSSTGILPALPLATPTPLPQVQSPSTDTVVNKVL